MHLDILPGYMSTRTEKQLKFISVAKRIYNSMNFRELEYLLLYRVNLAETVVEYSLLI